jgi:hypothetical protein
MSLTGESVHVVSTTSNQRGSEEEEDLALSVMLKA